MARRIPKGRKTDRRLGRKSVNLYIAAVCEGANTEPDYLIDFAKFHGNRLVEVEPIRAAGAPVTIVDRAVEIKKELERKSKRSGFSGLYEVWAIFDIDEHPNIPKACDKAKGNNIKLAISNPCFEIWPLLHFEDYKRPSHRHQLQKVLSRHTRSYDPKASKKLDFTELRSYYTTAKKRAKSLESEHAKVGSHRGNPSTGIYRLLEKVVEQGREK